MATDITGKYFEQNDFSQRVNEVLLQVVAKTGFQVEKEIARGTIYSRTKVGSILYKGTRAGKPAVLKLQGLRPGINEGEIIEQFALQNQSSLVRVPTLYVHEPWQTDRGYGFMITEYIDAPKIFEMPFASDDQMRQFARFYQDYRTRALSRPWFKPDTTDTLSFTVRRVNQWRKISESVGRLELREYTPYLVRYYPVAVEHLPSIPLVFSHGHLTANDIYVLPDGTFVVLSNIYWSYRPQWYDLAFNIWACWQWIRDTSYTFEQLAGYVEKWLSVYRTIPTVQEDSDFERKMAVLLLERAMGAILVDLGANDFYEVEGNQKYLRHLLLLHQRLFEYFEQKLQK